MELSTNVIEKNLARLAKQYLTPPPTSVDVERLFSHARQILSQRRSNVMPKNVEKILFCCENLPVINFKY